MTETGATPGKSADSAETTPDDPKAGARQEPATDVTQPLKTGASPSASDEEPTVAAGTLSGSGDSAGERARDSARSGDSGGYCDFGGSCGARGEGLVGV